MIVLSDGLHRVGPPDVDFFHAPGPERTADVCSSRTVFSAPVKALSKPRRDARILTEPEPRSGRRPAPGASEAGSQGSEPGRGHTAAKEDAREGHTCIPGTPWSTPTYLAGAGSNPSAGDQSNTRTTAAAPDPGSGGGSFARRRAQASSQLRSKPSNRVAPAAARA